jgi:hypothetical protein
MGVRNRIPQPEQSVTSSRRCALAASTEDFRRE